MRLFERLLFGEYKRMGISDPKAVLGTTLPAEPMDVLSARLTVGTEIIQSIATGTIIARPSIERLKGKQVIFTDGTRSDTDVIILATGYNMGFPFLEKSLVPMSANVIDLYKFVFHPDHPGLAFLGLCVVAGPVIPVIEMQARWAARVLAGRASLPTSRRCTTKSPRGEHAHQPPAPTRCVCSFSTIWTTSPPK